MFDFFYTKKITCWFSFYFYLEISKKPNAIGDNKINDKNLLSK